MGLLLASLSYTLIPTAHTASTFVHALPSLIFRNNKNEKYFSRIVLTIMRTTCLFFLLYFPFFTLADVAHQFRSNLLFSCLQQHEKLTTYTFTKKQIGKFCLCFAEAATSTSTSSQQKEYINSRVISSALAASAGQAIESCEQSVVQSSSREAASNPTQQPSSKPYVSSATTNANYTLPLLGGIFMPLVAFLFASPFLILRYLILKRPLSWGWAILVLFAALVVYILLAKPLAIALFGLSANTSVAALAAVFAFLITRAPGGNRRKTTIPNKRYPRDLSNTETSSKHSIPFSSGNYHEQEKPDKDVRQTLLAEAELERDKKEFFEKVQQGIASNNPTVVSKAVRKANAESCARNCGAGDSESDPKQRPVIIAYETAVNLAKLEGLGKASELPASAINVIYGLIIGLLKKFQDTHWIVDPNKTSDYLSKLYKTTNGLDATEKEIAKLLLLDNMQQEPKSTERNENAFYEQAWKEIQNNQLSSAIWAKSFSQAEGDNEKAKAFYVTHRVAQLKKSTTDSHGTQI